MFFLGSLYMERVLGYDPLEIGLAFLPVALAIGILSLGFSERLVMRFGAKPVLLVGLVLIVAGLVLFALSPVHSSYLGDLLAPMLLLGVGAGLSFPSLMGLAMSSATAAGLGARLGPGQHLAPGWRRARAGGPGDPLLDPHRQPAGERHLARRSPDQRLPPRLLDRRRPGDRGARGHDAGAPLPRRRSPRPRPSKQRKASPSWRASPPSGRRPNVPVPSALEALPSASSCWRICLLRSVGRSSSAAVAARSP